MKQHQHTRTPEEISDHNINTAVRPRSPGISLAIENDTLRIPRLREVALPEPVTWRALNGREPAAWEEPLITEARERERAAEATLLAGCCGP